jgi:Na+/H+ antiporter NhaD/arsenite permease-like protein
LGQIVWLAVKTVKTRSTYHFCVKVRLLLQQLLLVKVFFNALIPLYCLGKKPAPCSHKANANDAGKGEMSMKIVALLIFALTYALIMVFPKARAYIALVSATTFVLLGILPISELSATVDWNVVLVITGTMGIIALFTESKMPALLADLIIEKAPNIKWAVIFLSLFAGFISAFVDNVATVLMVAPVALATAKKLKISPVSSIIAIATASNLQGAATLVGDTTSILLAGHANLNFADFFFFKGNLGIFWVVQAGALAATLILFFIFRNDNHPVNTVDRVSVKDYFPTVTLMGMVVLLVLASFIPVKPDVTNGMICMTIFAIGLIRSFIITKDTTVFSKALGEVDYLTILLLVGLFVLVGGITKVGLVKDISSIFVSISNNNTLAVYSLIVWVSVLLSAFIDNIPYVATMLPVASGIASALNIEPYILYFGLLSGATLGGNLTPIGASANIAAIGILRKDGHNVSAREFMRIGVPFTLAAVVVGYAMIWLIWR